MISHVDWPPNGIFYHFRAASFPPHVTHLSLHYSLTSVAVVHPFNRDDALWWISVQPRDLRIGRRPYVPNLRHLSVSGVPTAFVAVVLEVCPNVETLELTRPEPLLDLAPLPSAVRTLVLCHPGIALSKGEMGSWALPEALDGGLFPTGETPPRIMVRSGTPDPTSFEALRGTCELFGIDLVYERDDA